MKFLKKLFLSGLLFIAFCTNNAFADDIGINAVRLIQLSDSTYVFETDFAQKIVYDFEIPIFPERFKVSQPEFLDKAGLFTIKLNVSTSGRPLNSKDVILLPWRRNGVSVTVRWLDGTISQGLFLRTIEGISIPINQLKQNTKTTAEVIKESIALGLNHIRFSYIHILLVLALALFLPKKKLLKALVIYAFGQAMSMLFFELGFSGFDLLFIDLLILFLVIALAVKSIKDSSFNYLNLLLFGIGLLHGLSLGNELKALELPMDLALVSLFICHITIDLIQFGLILVLMLIIIPLLKNKVKLYKGLKYALGTIAVFLIIGLFVNNVLTGDNHILTQTASQDNAAFPQLTQQNKTKATTRPQAAQTMTNPILSYLSIEPFEVRHEILIKANTALELLNISYEGKTEIPIDSLVSIQDRISKQFADNISIQIDGREEAPILSKANFVTLGMAGVSIRQEPMIESIEDGIIGLSFIYETETLANDVTLRWRTFPENMEKVDATTIDPFGGANFILTPTDPVLVWKSSMSGYRVPQVEEIAIESPRLSVLSLVLFIVAIVLLLLSNKIKFKKEWTFILIALGLVLYPFVRSPLNVSFIKQWKPSNERSAGIISGLLTNVYRSFDYRKESDMYDRLAISVIGDQLTQIYIEQRKGLEIENRGGAKAKVNDVEVIEVYNIEKGSKDDFGIEVSWKINGSVSHFGHMHYRQNRYRAIIWITPENGNWKIEKIEMLDEERLM